MQNKYILRIEELRKEYGYTKKKMAEICEMDYEYYKKMSKGNSIPKLDTVEKVCRGLDLTLQQFFTSDAVFGTATEKQNALMRLYISLDPENKNFIIKMAAELKRIQDDKEAK